MPVSTSGVSVPQLGQSFDTSMYSSIPKPQQTSLSDMLGMAKSSYELNKLKELYPAIIAKEQAQSKSAQARADTDVLENKQKHLQDAVQQQLRLINKPDLNRQDIIDSITEHAKNYNTPPSVVAEALASVPDKGTPTTYQAYLAQAAARNLTAQDQLNRIAPNTTQADLGATSATINQGNPLLASQPPGSLTGQYLNKSIAPQVVTNQITGEPTAFGGGGYPSGGNLDNRPTSVQVGPATGGTNISNITRPQTNVIGSQAAQKSVEVTPATEDDVLGKIEPLKQGKNESVANFNARVAIPQNSYAKAQDQLSNPNSENGYIPQLKQVNTNIMTLLKDPEVRTGAVNDYMAGRTNKASLTIKEQELAKYLEQRIQAKTPKSDADAESKRASYGSFNLDKEALKSLTRQDNAYILTQELAARGRINNARIGGTTNNPNFARVDAFNNKFAQLSSDPNLMQYIAIAGTNPKKIRVDADDDKALKSLLSGMSAEERATLELKRKTLLRMVGQ